MTHTAAVSDFVQTASVISTDALSEVIKPPSAEATGALLGQNASASDAKHVVQTGTAEKAHRKVWFR